MGERVSQAVRWTRIRVYPEIGRDRSIRKRSLDPLVAGQEQGLYAGTCPLLYEFSGIGRREGVMLAIIGGTSLRYADLPPLERRSVATPFGPAEVLCGDIHILLRHQQGVPPHRINFRANMAALAILGADRVIAIGSSGSLKHAIPPGSLVIPDDYISFAPIPSIHDHAIEHIHPGLSRQLREHLAAIVPDALAGGTYIQTGGPRIETRAEVQMLARLADIVGMTVASEATLAAELGMECAGLCTVDNYANGLGGELLTFEHILETSRQHRTRTEHFIRTIIRELG